MPSCVLRRTPAERTDRWLRKRYAQKSGDVAVLSVFAGEHLAIDRDRWAPIAAGQSKQGNQYHKFVRKVCQINVN